MPNSWERLGIVQENVEECNNLANYSTGEKSRRYWTGCGVFLENIKKQSFDNLTRAQRNWARQIVRELGEKKLSE
jgi:hypothetical protein